MLDLNGKILKAALGAIKPALTAPTRKEAVQNASQIVAAIVKTYQESVKPGEVGKRGKGPSGKIKWRGGTSHSGLVYGRIQSGKTRAMITSAA
jgi:hypothetical protein